MQSLLPGCYDYFQKYLDLEGFTSMSAKRNELASLVGSVCQYPSGLLKFKAKFVAPILAVTHNLPMLSTTGLMRGRKSSKIAPEDEICDGYQ